MLNNQIQLNSKQKDNLLKSRFKVSTLTTWLALCGFGLSSPAYSKDSTLKEEEEKKVVVTGSRIKKVDLNNLKPILSISREEFDKQGFASAKDVIDSITQNTGGTVDNSFTFGFTPAASSVNIRGLGFGHTLVLVDGRRLPIYPVGINGTSNFVDLSSIPTAFIERVDVLTDGASAVYGSDAVSGVINVITRKDIEGISMNYRFGDTSDGGFTNHRYNLMTGARNGDTQIDLIFDIWSQDALLATQRDYANSDVADASGSYSAGGVSFLGLNSGFVYQHPDCGTANDPIGGLSIADVDVSVFSSGELWCGFDRAPYRQLIAPQDKFSLMTRLSYEVTPDLTLFSRIGYSNSETDTQAEPNFYGGALFNGFGTAVLNNGAILPPGAVNNPTTGSAFEEPGVFVRRLVEFGPRQTKIENNSINMLLGLEGSFANGQYDWEMGLSFNRTELDSDSNNILLSALNSAVDNGLDLFETIPQSVVNALTFNANQESYSSNRVFDFSISGDLPVSLDAGPIQFALALEYVNEKYRDNPDPLVLQGDAFDGQTSGGGERDHLGIGGELSFPFSDKFELDIALRWDDYDDASSVNSAVSPRIAMAYRANENFLTRFSWGRSFRAPDMQRLFGGQTESFIDILDPEFLVDTNGLPCTDITAPDCSPTLIQSVSLLTGANIDLKEEEGSNLNLGFVLEFDNGLDLSIDYFQVELDEVVTAINPQSIVNLCTFQGLLCENVVRDGAGTLFGSSAFIESNAVNFAEQDTSGIDLIINYDWRNDSGVWSTSLNITRVNEFVTQFADGSRRIENVELGFLPEYRANFVMDWDKERWGATFRLNYVDKLGGAFCNGFCDKTEFVDSWTTTSVSGRYEIGDYTRIIMGINNLGNEAPPQDPTQTTWPFFINGSGYYNAVGREFYFQVDTTF
ncbi:TonB-dependent receptor domain-containing protein [Aliikangiella marina]|uniref:TonB-dependent receptor domain-containing protein n=1 Tax=Aliikangiella marina TaxID=1712262 RepID=UPI00163D69EF|nr:TonB-dependent receptor [Aliikangiella marina]